MNKVSLSPSFHKSVISDTELDGLINEVAQLVEKYVTKERAEKILETLTQTPLEKFFISPASAKIFYHGAYDSGLLKHTVAVIKAALDMAEMWNTQNKDCVTAEEVVVSALLHDLGKIGVEGEPLYIPTAERWQLERGMVYEINPKVQYMHVAQRSLYLCQKYGIELTENEYLAILLHDGLFIDGNKAYYSNFNPQTVSLPPVAILLHHADMMASRIEKEQDAKLV